MKSIDSLGQLAVRPIVERCRDTFRAHYKERLRYIVLYGSAARKEMTEESDIDLLVVLKQPLDRFEEIGTVVSLLYPLQIESSHWISAKPVAVNDFEIGRIMLYRNALKEGIVV